MGSYKSLFHLPHGVHNDTLDIKYLLPLDSRGLVPGSKISFSGLIRNLVGNLRLFPQRS